MAHRSVHLGRLSHDLPANDLLHESIIQALCVENHSDVTNRHAHQPVHEETQRRQKRRQAKSRNHTHTQTKDGRSLDQRMRVVKDTEAKRLGKGGTCRNAICGQPEVTAVGQVGDDPHAPSSLGRLDASPAPIDGHPSTCGIPFGRGFGGA